MFNNLAKSSRNNHAKICYVLRTKAIMREYISRNRKHFYKQENILNPASRPVKGSPPNETRFGRASGKFKRKGGPSRAQIEAGIKTSGEIKVSMLINLNSSAVAPRKDKSIPGNRSCARRPEYIGKGCMVNNLLFTVQRRPGELRDVMQS